jgi:hypothetical protein
MLAIWHAAEARRLKPMESEATTFDVPSRFLSAFIKIQRDPKRPDRTARPASKRLKTKDVVPRHGSAQRFFKGMDQIVRPRSLMFSPA